MFGVSTLKMQMICVNPVVVVVVVVVFAAVVVFAEMACQSFLQLPLQASKLLRNARVVCLFNTGSFVPFHARNTDG